MNQLPLKAIRFHQKITSPFLVVIFGSSMGCRFYPSCSEYTQQAVQKFGVKRGLVKGLTRVLRCNPFFEGGVDLV